MRANINDRFGNSPIERQSSTQLQLSPELKAPEYGGESPRISPDRSVQKQQSDSKLIENRQLFGEEPLS